MPHQSRHFGDRTSIQAGQFAYGRWGIVDVPRQILAKAERRSRQVPIELTVRRLRSLGVDVIAGHVRIEQGGLRDTVAVLPKEQTSPSYHPQT